MLAILIQNAFDGIINRYRCQNASGHSFPNIINDQLPSVNLVEFCVLMT